MTRTRGRRREWFLDHLLDFTVGFFVVVMLAFLVVDIVRDDTAGVGSVLVTLTALAAMWAIVRAGLRGRGQR